ncbi:MAG: amino acid carrier protein [Puniceicoccales bacterium]|jgi:AGCS family alanine or glycine:cation symporter|nr:amino acid carrier protein [Puniceicoccales bacterium]
MDTFLEYFVIFFVFPALIGISLYFSLCLKWPQMRHLAAALRRLMHEKMRGRKSTGKMGNIAAVATIIGGNLGAGTIVGTALAVATGGPGAIFWMIVVAILGSVVKLACASLGTFFQVKQRDGRYIGGPMFYIERGLSSRLMGVIYCAFLIGASFTVGNLVQTHVFVHSIPNCGFWVKVLCVLSFAAPVIIILAGGLVRFAAFMSCSVPIIGIVYILICSVGIYMMRDRVGFALGEIFRNAFSLASIGGGTGGVVLVKALHAGTSRGLFATDIGLGLAAIAHGNVGPGSLPRPQHAREQGIIALLAPILVALLCAITGILIVCVSPDFGQNASKICIDTFVAAFKVQHAGLIIPVTVYFFALTTILSWAWFAEHAFFFIGRANWRCYYRLVFVAMIPLGVFMHTTLPWKIADVCIDGLLLTNLLAIFLLRRRVISTQFSNVG